MLLNEIKTLYSKQYGARYGVPCGSSEHEITELEKAFRKRLPGVFREYLRWMGNDKRGRLEGSDWFLDNIHENTEYLSDFLLENEVAVEGFIQPLCFFVHQGYMAAWFDLGNSQDDPDCYYFFEGNRSKQIDGPVKFTSFLAKELGLSI